MKTRCQDTKSDSYERYGARGISVCVEWEKFEVFRDWSLANGYADDLTIDRYPDNNGNYEPTNCRWATLDQQVHNKRNNRFIVYKGERMLVTDLARRHGLAIPLVRARVLKYGWDIERAVTEPSQRRKPQ